MKKRISVLLSVMLAGSLLAGCGSKGKSYDNGELNVFVWTEYVSEDAIEGFAKEKGVKVNVSTFSSNEDMLSKLKSESEGSYDIILPSDYMVEQLIAQGMLEEIDVSKMDNFNNIDDVYKNPSYDPDNKYTVPYQGGVAAITVNTAKIDKQITSYADLFEPEFKDQIVMLDDFRAVIGITAKSLGYSMSETDPAKLNEIQDKLLTLKNNVTLYDSDSPKSALISGDANVGMIWSAEIALAKEENPDIQIVFPTEGAYVFIDNWAIPKGAKNYDNAVEFMNYMMGESAAKMNIEEFPYLTTNKKALQAMGDEYTQDEAKNPPADVIEGGEYIRNLDTDTLSIYSDMWTKLKE